MDKNLDDTVARIAERTRILIDLDVPAARKWMDDDVNHLSDEGILWGMHKVRIHATAVPLHLREESLRLLRDAGFSDVHGGPLPDRIEQ